ncbi:unnamed protein product [Gadus morhua 'NCC']
MLAVKTETAQWEKGRKKERGKRERGPCQRLFQTPPWPPQPWLWPRLRLETQGLATALQTDANNPAFTPV